MAVCVLIEKDGEANWCASGCERYHRGHELNIALDESDRGEKIREAFRKLARGEQADIHRSLIPWGKGKQVRNYLGILAEHTANGSVFVPDEIRAERRSVCDGCEHRNTEKDSCKLCGCSLQKSLLGDKLGWAVSQCPAGKWGKWKKP